MQNTTCFDNYLFVTKTIFLGIDVIIAILRFYNNILRSIGNTIDLAYVAAVPILNYARRDVSADRLMNFVCG